MYGEPEKPLLSAGTVADLDALLETLGLGSADVVKVEPSGTEQVGAWINKISPILLIIGIVGLYIEFKTPGFGVPGLVGITAFVIYFLGGYIAGLSSLGWGAVFILGLLLLVVELLLIPGTLITGLVGAFLMVGAILMALVDWDPTLPAYAIPALDQFDLPLRTLTWALLGSFLLIIVLTNFLPKTALYTHMVPTGASGTASEVGLEERRQRRVGHTGVVVSALRPGGKARFGEDVMDVVTQGEMVDEGADVKIIAYSGSTAVVVAV